MFQCKLLSVAFAAGHWKAVIFPWQLYCRFSPSCLLFFPSHLIFSLPYYFALLSRSPPSFSDIFLEPRRIVFPFLSRRLPALTKKAPLQFLKGYNNCRNADRVTLPRCRTMNNSPLFSLQTLLSRTRLKRPMWWCILYTLCFPKNRSGFSFVAYIKRTMFRGQVDALRPLQRLSFKLFMVSDATVKRMDVPCVSTSGSRRGRCRAHVQHQDPMLYSRFRQYFVRKCYVSTALEYFFQFILILEKFSLYLYCSGRAHCTNDLHLLH